MNSTQLGIMRAILAEPAADLYSRHRGIQFLSFVRGGRNG